MGPLLRGLKHAVALIAVFAGASCTGGGNGCAGGGPTPLPGGFAKDGATVNAGSVRLTRPGLDVLARNLPQMAASAAGASGAKNGLVTFDVPKNTQTTTILVVDYNIQICPNGPNPAATPPECVVEINVAGMKLHVDAVTPDVVKVSGTVPLRLRNLPVTADVIGDMNVGFGLGDCAGGAPSFQYKDFPLDVELPLVKELVSPRDGYTKVDVKKAIVNVTIDKTDIAICKECSVAQPICDGIFGFVKDLAFQSIVDGVKGQVTGALLDAFCTKPAANASPACPTGSQPDSAKAKCVYISDPATCVPMELGTDGHLDLGSVLKGISPGTKGGIDFGLAAGGDMNAAPNKAADDSPYPGHTPNGITFALLGGTAPNPTSPCVPAVDNPIPKDIPIPDEMLKDTQPSWAQDDPTGPHLGVAIAGRFLNHTLASIYQSGLLCLGVSNEQVGQLQSGLLSVLIPSLRKLTFEARSAPLAIATRPQAPPTIAIGGGTDIKKDPLLVLTLPKFAIDFYVWSEDRFIRAFTFTADVSIPLDLQTAKDPKSNPKGGVLPILGDLKVQNASVTNAEELLTDDPAAMGPALSAILQGLAGQALGGGIAPVDPSSLLSALGLTVTIPDGGIRKLHKGSDDFLAIFADIASDTTSHVHEAETAASLVALSVDREHMGLTTTGEDTLPSLRVALSSPVPSGAADGDIEYAWWIDDGWHSAWSREREITIRDKYLFYQGKHTLYASARRVGRPESEDSTPAAIPFVVDVLSPYVRIDAARDRIAHVDAWDIVSTDDALSARYRMTDANGAAQPWTDWAPYASVRDIAIRGATAVDVEVRDEQGNVGRAHQVLGADAGGAAPATGCACSQRGGPASRTGTGVSLAAFAALLVAAWRRRTTHRRVAGGRARAALGIAICAAAAAEGCSCGGGSNGTVASTGCGSDCSQKCQEPPPVGLVGAYTSVAKAKDGTLWVAGYSDAYVPPVGEPQLYGDLVVGTYDEGKHAVAWTAVDGLPARTSGCPEADPRGWRKGETDPGADVGRWTTLQLDAQDRPRVSYFDDTNTALKFAAYDGTAWSVHTVAQSPRSDIGRYAKMILVQDKPVIAYLQMEPGSGGATRSKVVVARAKTAQPTSGSDWTFEDALVDESGACRPSMCSGTQVCVKGGLCQATVTGCSPADCGTGKACVDAAGTPTCADVLTDDTAASYPSAVGDDVGFAEGPDGLGIVVYDRVHGNLVGLKNTGGSWVATTLDGQTGSGKDAVDTGNTGAGASLAIDAKGQWHVAYIDADTDTLRYLLAPGGATPRVEEVDDGSGTKLGGAPFADGVHRVGADTFVRVDDSGTVIIAYQDATAGTLRIATGASQPDGHAWTLRAVPQPGLFAGFFPRLVPGKPAVANWFRTADATTHETRADVALVDVR